MKRHEAIAPLSRDHHATLILAQLLKHDAPNYNGLPGHVKDKAVYAQLQFDVHIQKHFEQEETMLEMAKAWHAEIITLAEDIKNEHRQLTELFHALETEAGREHTMNTLGFALENHIRKEERVLFPLLQLLCNEEQLLEIYELLH